MWRRTHTSSRGSATRPQASQRSSGRRGQTRRLRFELLEDRRVLDSANIVGDTLVVEGGALDDRLTDPITLRLRQGNPNILEVFFSHRTDLAPDETFNRSQFTKVTVDGKGGDDEIIIDSSNGTFTQFEQVTVIGGKGDDRFGERVSSLGNSPGAVTYVGGPGDDTMVGVGGNDVFVGIDGHDTIIESPGRDTLNLANHPRKVILNLGLLDQRQVIDSAGNSLLIQDSLLAQDNPLVNVTASAFNDSIRGNGIDNRILGGNGNDILDGGDGRDDVFGGGGDDAVSGGADNDNLRGDNGNDRQFGEAGDDTLLAGNDTEQVNGGTGDDTFQIFEEGFHTIVDPSGIDTVDFSFNLVGDLTVDLSSTATQSAGPGLTVRLNGTLERARGTAFFKNTLTGNAARNFLIGGLFDDVLRGGAGDDVLEGGVGNDSLFGEAGVDNLRDGKGNDSLDGGEDDDLYILTPGSTDTVQDTGGTNDTLDFASATAGITISLELAGGEAQVVDAAGNVVSLTGTFENVTGSNFSDDITGNAAANSVNALAGDDVVRGGAGNDFLQGGDDNDNLRGQAGDDFLRGEGGDDTLNGGGNDDQLEDGDGDDLLEGAGGNDALFGDAGTDTLLGGTGDDSLRSLLGNEIVQGEAGFDTLQFLAPTLNDPVREFIDVDLDPVTGELVLNVRATAGGVPLETHRISTIEELNIAAGGGNDNVDLRALSAADLQAAGLPGVRVEGETGNDTVRGTRGPDTINGGIGNDTLRGDDGDDQINGGEGNDKLFGEDGNDTASGEAGNDDVIGDDGDDTLLGGDDDDTLLGGEGNDTLDGGAGDNILDGGPGQDGVVFYGTAGNDNIRVRRQVGPSGAQVIFEINGEVIVEDYRNGETVFVFAGGGNDQVVMDTSAGATWSAEFHGQGGHDQLTGAQRNDLLDGGEGNDLLFGLAGRDTFIGGPGLDIIFATDGEIDRIVAEVFDVLLKDAHDEVA